MYRESFPAYKQFIQNQRPRKRGSPEFRIVWGRIVVVGRRQGQALSGVAGFYQKSSLAPFTI